MKVEVWTDLFPSLRNWRNVTPKPVIFHNVPVFQAQCWSTLDCVGLGLPALCRAVLGSLEETRRKEAWFLTSVHLQAPLGDRACNEMIISRQKWLVAPHPDGKLFPCDTSTDSLEMKEKSYSHQVRACGCEFLGCSEGAPQWAAATMMGVNLFPAVFGTYRRIVSTYLSTRHSTHK